MAISDKIGSIVGRWMMSKFTTPKFFSHLEDHLFTLAEGREKELVKEIKKRAGEIYEEDKEALIVDEGSKGMLVMSAAVLAAYEVLVREIGDKNKTILFLQHVFTEVNVHTNSLASRLLLRRKGKVLDVVESFMEPLTKAYGSTMTFEFIRDGDDSYDFRVTKCFFKEFFERRGVREVTTIICAADAFWMNEIDPALMGVYVERTSIMSLGDDYDSFRVVTTDDPLIENRDCLDKRGPGRPEYKGKS